jgi:16S rRNA (adenine1518-N6/adenine1519-N6)-dimethyltransferase
MVQKEFAERLSAKPNTKAYNALSVMMQLSFNVHYVFTVTKKVFYPIPKVDSAIITLTRTDDPNKNLHTFIKDCFQQKRKTLLNNIYETRKIEKAKISEILISLGYNPQARAEQIKQSDFKHIYSKTLT